MEALAEPGGLPAPADARRRDGTSATAALRPSLPPWPGWGAERHEEPIDARHGGRRPAAAAGSLPVTGPDLPAAARSLLDRPPPPVDVAAVEVALRDHYGLDGRARALAAERDRNFMVTLTDGTRRVFKVYHEADDAPTRAFQHGALLHMERVGVGAPVPRLVRTRHGGEECEVPAGGHAHQAILITVVPGAPGDLAAPGAAGVALRRDVGRAAAAIGAALADYDHPAGNRVLLWDLMQLGGFSGLVDTIADPTSRRWLAATVERFVGEVRPRAARLPAQVIHNDLNGGNVFVDGDRVCGVIDFGDMVRAPRVNEVAVAANYCMSAERDPVAAIGDVLDGYDALRPLDEAEVDLLHDLVSARLALRILMYQWRAALFPDNRDYILRNGEAARRLADRFARTPPGAGRGGVLKRWSDGRRGR